MIDWLRRAPAADPVVEVAGRVLPVVIRRHPRATRLTMRLARDGGALNITMPRWSREAEALAFARSRAAWIAGQLAKVVAAVEISPGAQVPYRGIALRLDWSPAHPRQPCLAPQAIRIGGPREGIAPRLQRWLEGQALVLFGEDLAHYCARAEQPVPRLLLSRARRRWGSCAAQRDGGRAIRLNWRLVMAPDPVRRSVVAHEVAHLTHFDHSPTFHAHLAALYDGDLRAADLWLKREGRALYTILP